jgi:hypothetical protein
MKTTVERTVGADFHQLLAHKADENDQASDSPENQLNAVPTKKAPFFPFKNKKLGDMNKQAHYHLT